MRELLSALNSYAAATGEGSLCLASLGEGWGGGDVGSVTKEERYDRHVIISTGIGLRGNLIFGFQEVILFQFCILFPARPVA